MGKDDLDEMYVSASLRSFAIGLVGIFIPIFLYKQGWSLTNILFFFMLFFMYSLLAGKYFGEYATKNGAKHLMALSFAFSFAALAFLSIDQSILTVFCIVAPLYAAAESAYWLSNHIILTETKESGHVGRAVAKYNILVGLFSALGPFIGGIIGEKFGLRVAFMLSLVVLLVALRPLFMLREEINPGTFDLKKLEQDKGLIHDMGVLGIGGIANAAAIVFWPLFIYSRTGGLLKTGLIVAASLSVTTLACWLAGQLSDNKKGRKVRKIGSLLWAISSISMVLSPSIIILGAANMLAYVSQMLSIVPRSATMISHSFKEYRAEYMTVLFISLQFFKVLFMVIMVFVSQQFGDKQVLNIGVVFGGVMSLAYLYSFSRKRDVKIS
ncbi:hypothetical protein A3F37_03765 [Candidatus Saccharibacteria bacterium RIFCSPHIGHO2_12_FULL_41_12]|nr:MAG: hypothetical protein A3F37_03765 [Candidatus Saccharibacteria bacterium RIFCSPHIGHO2_12_FULL_41_12]